MPLCCYWWTGIRPQWQRTPCKWEQWSRRVMAGCSPHLSLSACGTVAAAESCVHVKVASASSDVRLRTDPRTSLRVCSCRSLVSHSETIMSGPFWFICRQLPYACPSVCVCVFTLLWLGILGRKPSFDFACAVLSLAFGLSRWSVGGVQWGEIIETVLNFLD